ncbi:hypothetical protein AF395_24020, partial [Salmonella enterica subsp. enterica serovar Typhimurium]
EQGSKIIEKVLSYGTGSRIVPSNYAITQNEIQLPAIQYFRLAHKELDNIIKRAQVRPLAEGVPRDRQLLQFCYHAAVADSELTLLAD